MAVANRLANLPNEPDQEPQVVDRREPVSQDLAGHEEVAQIRSGKSLAGIAIAAFVRRTWVLDEPTVAQVDSPTLSQDRAVAGDPGGQHAIEHVDATGDRFDQVGGRTDTHQVARAIARQDGGLHQQQAVGQRFRFTEAQAAHAEAVKGEAAKELRTLPPKVFVEAALDDPKPQLARRAVLIEAAQRPAVG